jgi:hypothetical protein
LPNWLNHSSGLLNLGKARNRYALFLRFRALVFGFMVQNDVIALFMSFTAAVCWRRTAAAPIPRPVAAARFAALSHILKKGFFTMNPCWRRCGVLKGIGVVVSKFHVFANCKPERWLDVNVHCAAAHPHAAAVFVNEQHCAGFQGGSIRSPSIGIFGFRTFIGPIECEASFKGDLSGKFP